MKFTAPVDYWLEYTDKGILTLHFTLPLEHPVPADATGFNFAVFDSSYFIAFDFAEADPIKLSANAPAGCKPSIHEPPEDTDTQQLSDAFSSALGQDAQQQGGGSGPMSATGAVSIGSSKSVNIECAKS